VRQAETYLLQSHYDGFLKKGRIKGRSTGSVGGTAQTISEKQIAWLLVLIALIALGGVILSIR